MQSTHRLPLLLSAGIAGLLLTALPLGFDGSSFEPVSTQAWAGGENGNGNGNGHGNGHGNGKGKHAEIKIDRRGNSAHVEIDMRR
jgi:hypothetical protein